MVKVTAPAMSLDASGTLAGTLVFSKWKGRNYVRERVTPANPKSAAQVGVRQMFKFLSQQWEGTIAADKLTWADRADDMIVSPFNAYVSYAMKNWQSFLAPSWADPATRDDDMTGNINWTSSTGGVGMVTVEWDVLARQHCWGILVFRSIVDAGFTPTIGNLVGVVPVLSDGDKFHIDKALDPDEYFYKSIGFNRRGQKDSIKSCGSATAT